MKKIKSVGVIDDDPITIFGIKKMLNSLNICDTVITYTNGKQAIEGLKGLFEQQAEVPEVLFLDINMPIMDGWQFLEEFIALPLTQKVRINILTSSIDPLDRNNWEYYRTRTHHIIDFKHKPIRMKDIEEITKAA